MSGLENMADPKSFRFTDRAWTQVLPFANAMKSRGVTGFGWTTSGSMTKPGGADIRLGPELVLGVWTEVDAPPMLRAVHNSLELVFMVPKDVMRGRQGLIDVGEGLMRFALL